MVDGRSAPISERARDDLRSRLACLRDRVDGIYRMVEAERDCAEISREFVAVSSQLKSAEERFLDAHIECVERVFSARLGPGAPRVHNAVRDTLHRLLRLR